VPSARDGADGARPGEAAMCGGGPLLMSGGGKESGIAILIVGRGSALSIHSRKAANDNSQKLRPD